MAGWGTSTSDRSVQLGTQAFEQQPTHDHETGRRVRRPKPLPGGRAVVGGFLIAVAAVGSFALSAAGDGGPTTVFAVAAHDLAPGSRIQPGDIRLVALDVPDAAVRGRLFGNAALLRGASVVSPLAAGELVTEGDVVGRGSRRGMREVSFVVNRTRAVAGTLKVGERIDLLGTFGSGTESWTAFLAAGLRVIAIDRPESALGESAALVITVEARDAAEAAAVANAAVASEITVVRAADIDGPAPTDAYRPPAPPSRGGS